MFKDQYMGGTTANTKRIFTNSPFAMNSSPLKKKKKLLTLDDTLQLPVVDDNNESKEVTQQKNGKLPPMKMV